MAERPATIATPEEIPFSEVLRTVEMAMVHWRSYPYSLDTLLYPYNSTTFVAKLKAELKEAKVVDDKELAVDMEVSPDTKPTTSEVIAWIEDSLED